ncbi:MAG: hypothetical protein JSV00_01215 [bacterium]|nr:MAG: hypothetical protein JSV00_01215 [bacterium]
MLLILALGAAAWVFRPARDGGVRPHAAAVVLGVVSIAILVLQARLKGNLSDARMFPRFLDLDSWGLSPAAAQRLRNLTLPERADHLMLQAHVVFRFFIWGLGVVVGVFGLALALWSGQWRFTALFGVVALTILFYNYPSYPDFVKQNERWKVYLEEGRGGKKPGSGP